MDMSREEVTQYWLDFCKRHEVGNDLLARGRSKIHADPEFWADHTTNSGIFIRATDPGTITATSSYEVNIFDQRPEPAYGTGAIVDVASVSPMPKAGGKWNTFDITARGPQLIVVFNGVQTVNVRHSAFAGGPFALQFANGPKDAPGGAIKWRKVQIRSL